MKKMYNYTFRHKQEESCYFVRAEDVAYAWYGLIQTLGVKQAALCDLVSCVEVNDD